MPPAPIGDTISYGPNLVPEVSAIDARNYSPERLEAFPLAPWASRRGPDLLELLDRLSPTIAELTQTIEQKAEKCAAARRLRTHPGVGSLTAPAFALIIRTTDRFQRGKQIASYLGLVPSEESSGDRRRLGHISKQGNTLLRFLLDERLADVADTHRAAHSPARGYSHPADGHGHRGVLQHNREL